MTFRLFREDLEKLLKWQLTVIKMSFQDALARMTRGVSTDQTDELKLN